MLMNPNKSLTLPRARHSELIGLDEEAAVFMNVQPAARKEDVWQILNTSMTNREKIGVLKDDFNSGEVRLVKKWLHRHFPPKNPFNTSEPHFLIYLKFDDSVKAAKLVEQQDFEGLDRMLESYSIGPVQLYRSWKACIQNETQMHGNNGKAVEADMLLTGKRKTVEDGHLTKSVKEWIFYIYFMCLLILFFFFIKLKQLADNGRIGLPEESLLKMLLYIPSIVFTFYYPFVGHKSEHPSIASPWLRLLISVVAFVFVFYEAVYIFSCWTKYYGWTCSQGIIFERVLELIFFIGLTIFVIKNNCYPRQNKLYFVHLCLSAVFAYLNILFEEEIKIYEEILKDQDSTIFSSSQLEIVRSNTISTRGYRMAEPLQPTSLAGGSQFEVYFEMCYVVISAFLIVAIFIVIAILNDLGNVKQPQEKGCDTLLDKAPFILYVPWSIVPLAVIGVLYSLGTMSRNGLLFLHFLILLWGTAICLNSLMSNEAEDKEENRSVTSSDNKKKKEVNPAEVLDRYLLNFGAVGMLGSITVGTIHLYGIWNKSVTFAEFVIYGLSIFQVIAQTIIILSGSKIQNIKGANGKALWLVNFALFCLDLFNTATLGVYYMPIPRNTNLLWAWLVRGLGSFEVFYRFHSLAVIAQNIEYHEQLDESKE